MAKINLYWQDLKEETQLDLIAELKKELASDIQQEKEDNLNLDPDTLEVEFIDNYINTHNFANEFKI